MKFQSIQQHSLDQIKSLESFVANLIIDSNKRAKLSEVLFVLTELAMHGSSAADTLMNVTSPQSLNSDTTKYLAKIKNVMTFIRRLPDFNLLKKDEVFYNKTYEKEGFFFVTGSTSPGKLVVVFTTMFNNFQISNLAFYSLLRQYGVSVLMLKDCTYFNYLNGVRGLGSNIFEISDSIKKIILENEINETYITGFSSGGYASLFSSYLIPCKRYLGFSIASDLSAGAKIFPGKFFTNEVRARIDKKYLLNLRELAVDRNDQVDRTLIFGDQSSVDTDHAMNMAGTEIKLIQLKDCLHTSVFSMISDDTFSASIKRLLS